LIRTEDEELLAKVAELIQSTPITYPENDIKPMSVDELNERLQKAEEDISSGRVYTTTEAKKKLES